MAQATKLPDLTREASAPGSALCPMAAAAPVHPPAERLEPTGPRKLVRPRLPIDLAPRSLAPRRLRGSAPLAARAAAQPTSAASLAEQLYFQKQMQAQTRMVFLLEDSERIEGVIEWFDRDAIKVRNHTRTLIYKRSVKYIYKAECELQG